MKNIDRRKFMASTMAAVPAVAIPSYLSVGTTQNHSDYLRFISYKRHVAQFGETQALADLRDGYFPIPLGRLGVLGHDFRYRQDRHERLAEYLTFHYQMPYHESHWAKLLEQPGGQFWRTMMLTVPSGKPIRDWWLWVSRKAKTDIRISVVLVTSDRSIDNLGSFFSLADRINRNVDKQRRQLSAAIGRRLIQTVNQQIVQAMRMQQTQKTPPNL